MTAGAPPDARADAAPHPLLALLAAPWARRAGALAGLALLLAAVLLAWSRRDAIAEVAASGPTGAERWLLVAALAATIAVNVVLTGLFFTVLLRRFGRVAAADGVAVTATATLFNYLPLRPGMAGRIAWHRAADGIRVRDGVRTSVEAVAMSALVAGSFLLGVVAARGLGAPAWVGAALPGAAVLVAVIVGRRGPVVAALAIRWVEVLLWAVRAWLAFRLVGVALDLEQALAVAAVGVAATAVPLVSNGIGLREWATGLLAPAIGAGALEEGVAAELAARAVEVLAVLPLGALGAAWLVRRRPGGRDASRDADGTA